MDAEALYMAKTAYDAYTAIVPSTRPFAELPDVEKAGWEAASHAVHILVMRALVPLLTQAGD